jgi:hypothetical protein
MSLYNNSNGNNNNNNNSNSFLTVHLLSRIEIVTSFTNVC